MSAEPANSADYETARQQKGDHPTHYKRLRRIFPKGKMTAEQREAIVCFLIDYRENARYLVWKWNEWARREPTKGVYDLIDYWTMVEKVCHGLIKSLEPRTR